MGSACLALGREARNACVISNVLQVITILPWLREISLAFEKVLEVRFFLSIALLTHVFCSICAPKRKKRFVEKYSLCSVMSMHFAQTKRDFVSKSNQFSKSYWA